MRYTFLLPAYKAAFFKEALGSILNQTYSDFNVIVSDDCSPEDLKSIVESFGDSRVSYRRNDRNIGAEHLVDHWNLLLGLTDSEYVIMASDDDVYASNYLEQMDNLVVKYPELNTFRPRLRLIDANGKEFWHEKVAVEEGILDRKRLASLIASEKFLSGIPQFIFKRKALAEMGGFIYYPYAWCSDDATVATASATGVAFCNDILFSFRHSGKSISTRKAVHDNEWKCEISAAVEYINNAPSIYEIGIDNPLIGQMVNKARKNLITMLKESDDCAFRRIMNYIGILNSSVFPFKWRVERRFGRVYHKIFR